MPRKRLLLFLLAAFSAGSDANSPTAVQTESITIGDSPSIKSWLYLPPAAEGSGTDKPLPLVILAPALGFSAEASLRTQAEVLALSGLAALSFDYPASCMRQLSAVDCHRGALQHVLAGLGSLEGHHRINREQIAVVGVEFSAGIALDVLAEAPHASIIVAQTPYIGKPKDRLQHLQSLGPAKALQLLLLSVQDLLWAALGLPGPTIPLTGPPGSVSLFHMPPADQEAQQQALHGLVGPGVTTTSSSSSSSSSEEPHVPAALVLPLLLWDAMGSLPHVEVPVVFYATARDGDCGLHEYGRAAKRGRYISFESVGCQRYSLISSIAGLQDFGRVQQEVEAGLKVSKEGLQQAAAGLDAEETSISSSSSSNQGLDPEAGGADEEELLSAQAAAGDTADSGVCGQEQVELVLVDQAVLLNTVLHPEALDIIPAQQLGEQQLLAEGQRTEL